MTADKPVSLRSISRVTGVARRRLSRQGMLIAAISAAFPCAALAVPAARVEFATGNPVAVSPSGQSRSLVKGVQVESGETVSTNNGRVQLRFTDGAQVSLQPQSEFRIDEYRFDGKADGSERGFFSLFKGGLRTITGLVGRTNRKNYQVTTTVATIGIRGTEYTIAYTNSITGSVGEGEVEVCSGIGCVPFGSGQSFIVTDPGSRPRLTSQKSDLPPPPPENPASKDVLVKVNDVDEQGEPAAICRFTDCIQEVTPPPPPTPLLTGTASYTVAYSNNPYGGLTSPDSRFVTGSTGTIDSMGRLASFTTGMPSLPVLNTFGAGTYFSTDNDGTLAWGAFKNGPITGGALAGTLANGYSIHYVVGVLPPTGTSPAVGTYTLIGATTPTWTPNSPTGTATTTTLNSATFTVTLGASPSVALALNLTHPTLGAILPSGSTALSGHTFTMSLSVPCTSCSGSADGFFAGTNADHAGVSYVIQDFLTGQHGVGALAFKK